MELKKLGEKTYVLLNPVNVGIYLLNDFEVCVIDSGSSKDYGKEISKVIEENNWHLKYIINTHSHADHISGNAYLQNKYHCRIFASKVESYFINAPILESALMYGAKPIDNLCNSFLMAKPSCCEDINNISIEGLEIVDLSGHSFGLIGVLTSDNVLFVGDAYTSPKILEKYQIQYTYDVANFIKTLDFLEQTNYKFYVPSHGDIESDITHTIKANKDNILNIEAKIEQLLLKYHSYNEMLNELFKYYHIRETVEQYYIVGTTIKSIITKLVEEDKISLSVKDATLWIEKK